MLNRLFVQLWHFLSKSRFISLHNCNMNIYKDKMTFIGKGLINRLENYPYLLSIYTILLISQQKSNYLPLNLCECGDVTSHNIVSINYLLKHYPLSSEHNNAPISPLYFILYSSRGTLLQLLYQSFKRRLNEGSKRFHNHSTSRRKQSRFCNIFLEQSLVWKYCLKLEGCLHNFFLIGPHSAAAEPNSAQKVCDRIGATSVAKCTCV